LEWIYAVSDPRQYDFGFATGAPRKRIIELARVAFVERAENVVFLFKLPPAPKREIEQLRNLAEEAGLDLGETITAVMWRLCTDQGGTRKCSPSSPEIEMAKLPGFGGETVVRIFRNFSAALRRAERVDSKGTWQSGKGRSFVQQDKGPAVRCGIFGRIDESLGILKDLRSLVYLSDADAL